MTWSPGRRVAISIGLSTLMVLLIATLIPRAYLANDDIGFTEYLRKDTFTPWISPILSQAFRSAYVHAPGMPWWGLYQYALIIVIGAVVFHTCTELIDRRAGLGNIVTMLGALVLGASHAILAVGITWTTVSIAAIGTAAAAFVAHALLCQATGKRMSVLRSLFYGVLLACGYMLRQQGLAAAAVALLPLGAWAALLFVRKRHLPRLTALVAVIAPLALVFAIQGRMPQGWNEATSFEQWTNERGRLHAHAAYDSLDRRAPELITQAGWTIEEYRDFANWLIIDEADYPIEKMQRLLATGGVPEVINAAWSYKQLRSVVEDSAASVFLFLTLVVAGLVLAWFGAIERGRGLAFCLGYFVFLVGVPLAMAAYFRFPQRVSLTMFTVAALGIFIYLARAFADRPAGPEVVAPPRGPALGGVIAVAVLLLGWALHLVQWIDRPAAPDTATLRALDDRIAARGGFVFVYVQAGLIDFDPLRARPRSYDGLQGGWGTFSTPWYGTIKERLGVQRGADVLGAMVDNPEAYLLSQGFAREALEDWIRRKLGKPEVRLAIVDGAEIRHGGRPELYRLVTSPLVRDSEEWRMMVHDELATAASLPRAPSVSGLPFRPVTFGAPYEQHVSTRRHRDARIELAPIDGGLRGTVTGGGIGCVVTDADGHHAGIRVPINGLSAARFELALINPENILAVTVHAQSKTSRAVRWRWELSPQAQQLGFTGAFTAVPGSSDRRLRLELNSAKQADLRDLHISIGVMPGTQAGFELRKLEIAEP